MKFTTDCDANNPASVTAKMEMEMEMKRRKIEFEHILTIYGRTHFSFQLIR